MIELRNTEAVRIERAGQSGERWRWTRVERVLCVKCDNMSLCEELHKVTDEFKWW